MGTMDLWKQGFRKIQFELCGKPSLFEGKTSPPEGSDEVKLQILAADQAGNFGQHTLSFSYRNREHTIFYLPYEIKWYVSLFF